MTLREKFENYYDPVWYDKETTVHYCEKIADEFAIGFVDWLIKRETKYFESLKELLEIYKKEKGL